MLKYLLIFYFSLTSLRLAFAERDEEASSLLSIKRSVIDPLDQLKDWNKTLSYCNWTGVICNPNGFVDRLDLSNMNLSGNISNQIDQLKGLSYLNLSYNGFYSVLPDSLSNLTSLQALDLSSNSFTGNFISGLGRASGLKFINFSSNNFEGILPDDLGNATALEILDLRGSFFEGLVPRTLKNLQKLNFLGLSGNNFSGEIPPEIGQLFSLKTLIAGYNEFEGSIPREFGNLTNLEYLDLAVGSLSGEIPKEFGKMKKLTTVYLYQNNFEGKIPNEIGNLTSLMCLDLSDNQISGQIPYEITYLENLQLLNLMCNKLSGQVPKRLGELKGLKILELWQNHLTGPLPESLGRNSPLEWLDVSSNLITGEIPIGLCASGNLTKLILFNNSFSGLIPLGLSNCSSLVRVRVQNNLISGMIPIGFGSLPNLQRLELASNNLTGRIPDDISLSLSLAFVDLSRNHLEYTLPTTILSMPNLQVFMVSNNDLKGNIPDELEDCPSLTVLDLSSNHFYGKIPRSLASCGKLVTLNLRNNQLNGEIPRALSSMPTLSILDLSRNSLCGEIPASFGSSPALEMLNVSYNRLEGPVPSNGMLRTINPSDLIGNDGLCGATLPPCSRGTLVSSRFKRLHVNHIVIGFIVGISVILALGLAFFICKRMYKRWYLYGSFFSDWHIWNTSEWPWRLTAFQRLKFTSDDIINRINEENVIGMGANGVVYKAEIPRIHSTFAVKKLWRYETKEDLFGEVDLLGRLRHRNIVKLLGYLHNENEVMMVYEYMPNGNLGEALHGENSGKMLVDWVSRYNVALGVAQGLSYLHHDCYPPIIHRDVKSNNILLDVNFEARIADFGLARTMLVKNETVSMVAGSYGYIAPEYGYTLKVDEKSDVYSYGVVLLELVTGKQPLDPTFGEYTEIVEWVRSKIKINKAVEEALEPETGGQCGHVQEEMLLVLKIALLCTAKNPKDRPSMRDIITMLGEAKPRRKSICLNEKPSFTNSPVVGLL